MSVSANIECSFSLTLKLSMSESGIFKSVRLLKGRSNLGEDILELLNKTLQEALVPTPPIRTTVEIGDDAEQKVLNHLLSISQVNSDFKVTDTSSMTNHGDIAVVHAGKRFCIEVKCYTKPVPMKEVEKAHKSLDIAEYDAGIMIQMNPCGYCTSADISTPIDVKVVNGKPMAYLTAPDLALVYPVVRLLISNMKEGVDKTQEVLEGACTRLKSIGENVNAVRNAIDVQKKTIAKLKETIDTIAKLAILP